MSDIRPSWGHPVRPKRGDVWTADGAESIVVNRVSVQRDGCPSWSGWADIRVQQSNGATWTKRQPLPFPALWSRSTPVVTG